MAGRVGGREITRERISARISDGDMIQADLSPTLQSRSRTGYHSTVPKVVATNLGLSEGMQPTVWFDATGLVVFDFRTELQQEVATDGGEE